MIKVDHIITFPETDGLALLDPLPEAVVAAFSSAREEAASRGCVLFSYENAGKTERTAMFIWEDADVMNEFNEWANVNANYAEVYAQFVEYVQSKGGTITKTVTEF